MTRLTAVTLAILLGIGVNAQSISREVIASAGEYFTSPVGSLSWTLGEVVIETVENSSINFILTQGFQQPDELDDTTSIWEIPTSNIFGILYPNPTVESVRLDLKCDQNSRIKIELVDMLGRVLNSDEMDVLNGQLSNYELDVSTLASGMYMFRLTSEGKVLNSYKFQKVAN